MEQLTQMEPLDLQDLMEAEALAVRKCELYEQKCKSDELKNWFQDAAQLHRDHVGQMLTQLRNHDGREREDLPPVH